MEDALDYERRFFEKNYKELASRAGSPYLAKKLSMLLSDHINKNLPDVEVIFCFNSSARKPCDFLEVLVVLIFSF